MKFVFFGTPDFATIILDELSAHGFRPALIVTAPDKPKGRKLMLTPSETSVWAKAHEIPLITPGKLDDAAHETLKSVRAELFIVAAYGKILTKRFLDLPARGVLNVHPSLLPKFRGASPIESAILSEETETGVSIILLDEETDHGPLLARETVSISPWPPKSSALASLLARRGGALLSRVIPQWMNGELKAEPQGHALATYTKKIAKEDGLIELSDDPMLNLKKIRAFSDGPGAYFFVVRAGKSMRVKILDAEIADGALLILSVVPEGRKAMAYEDFKRGLR